MAGVENKPVELPLPPPNKPVEGAVAADSAGLGAPNENEGALLVAGAVLVPPPPNKPPPVEGFDEAG